MPIRRNPDYIAPTATKPETEPSFLQKLYKGVGGMPGILAGSTRAATGALSAEGFLPGAAISGLGELGAEGIEGSLFTQSPGRTAARVGTAAGIGAVPFGAVLKAGRPLASAARGALYSGVGEAAREIAAGEDVSPGRIATSAGLGGVVTGGLSKLLSGGKSAPVPTNREEYLAWKARGYKPEVAPTAYVVEPTAQTGPGTMVRTGGKITRKGELTGSKPIESVAPKSIMPEGGVGRPVEPMVSDEPVGAYSGEAPAPYRAAAKQGIAAEAKLAKEEEKAATEQRKQEAIQANIKRLGLLKKKPSFSSSKSAKIGDETVSQRTAYGAPKKSAKLIETDPIETAATRQEQLMPEGPAAPTVEPEVTAAPVLEAPVAKAAKAKKSPLAKVLTPAQEAQQKSYSELEAKLKGEAPPVPGEPVLEAATPLPEAPTAPPGIEPPQTGVALPEGRSSIVEPPRAPVGGSTAPAGTPLPDLLARMRTRLTEAEGKVPVGTMAPEAPSRGWGINRADQPDEVQTVGDALRDTYEGMAKGPEKGRVGAQLSELRNFMSGKGKQAFTAEETAARGGVPTAPEVPTAPAAATDWMAEQNKLIEEMKASKERASLGKRIKGQKGELSQALATRLGLGAAGAAVGGAVDPLGGDKHTTGSRLASAAAGGLAGAAIASIPAVLNKIGASAASLTTPEGITETAKKLYHQLPAIQRFNYLMTLEGLPANVVAGPVGSGFHGALEAMLSGDTRGKAALGELMNPIVLKDIKESWKEAVHLIGRAEGTAMSEAPNLWQKSLAAPGTAMTTGDRVVVKALRRAGFSEEEARRMTLTSEPEGRFAKKLASLTSGSPMAQMLFPFTRTPTNILEQGLRRIPGVGFIAQAGREVPDSMRQQLVQQGMGAVVGTGSGVLGESLDPETAKLVKRYVSNFGGQYSLPANIGYTIGQAIRSGKPTAGAAATSLAQGIPLPTADPIIEWAKFLSGESTKPPGGMIPKQFSDLLFPKKAPSLRAVRPSSGIRRR